MGQESEIQSEVVVYGRSYGLMTRKMDKGEGWPDFLFIGRGRVLFIEFKAPGERPSKAQLEVMRTLADHGIECRVVSDAEEGKNILFTYFKLAWPWTKSSSMIGGSSPVSR